ncbi:Kazal peptide Pr13a-like [Neocloeon triangulifer]|uniref:Kazal peptide Pr13a-like n=1 Tax=Neocloeon triangulifer TaxID=2078957 RepID=UPI00286F88A9|nr:Kazal peptide Pr13a-like [Neocloeon triangulifer]
MRLCALLLSLVVLLVFAFGAEAIPANILKPPSNANKSNAMSPSGGCNCRCNLSHNDVFCGVDPKNEKQTFQNDCQLDCYNCTHDAAFRRRYSGECKK